MYMYPHFLLRKKNLRTFWFHCDNYNLFSTTQNIQEILKIIPVGEHEKTFRRNKNYCTSQNYFTTAQLKIRYAFILGIKKVCKLYTGYVQNARFCIFIKGLHWCLDFEAFVVVS